MKKCLPLHFYRQLSYMDYFPIFYKKILTPPLIFQISQTPIHYK